MACVRVAWSRGDGEEEESPVDEKFLWIGEASASPSQGGRAKCTGRLSFYLLR
jgi:hypothetical protein